VSKWRQDSERPWRWFGAGWPIVVAGGWALTLLLAPLAEGQIVIRGETVYTMAGAAVKNGVVVIEDDKIVAVGPADQVDIPPDAEVFEAKVVTPGLIDAHATAGLTGIFNQSQDQDQLDSSEAIQPELRALDAINIQEELVGYLRGFGVTTLHTGHASRELISGQTLIVKTVGQTVEEALVRETAAVVATLGPAARRNQGSPGTRGKQMAMLRQELIKAGEYLEKVRRAEQRGGEKGETEQDETDRNRGVEGEGPAEQGAESNGAERSGLEGNGSDTNGAKATPPARNLRLEALAQVLDGQIPLLITANKAQDIASALRLADEFGIRIWLDGAAESYLLTEEIKRAEIPVLLHPTMIRATGEYENLSFETAAHLVGAGIPVAMQSGYEGYVPKVRVVLFEAAITAAHGLSFEQALATITIDAARILQISDRVGSLEVGKDADIALYDGDPFEYTSRCVGVLVNGRPTGDPVR
jgi:imidazolonepropionase-like amidohydrolase